MRKQALILLVMMGLLSTRVNGQGGGVHPIASVSFSPGVGADCMASVNRGSRRTNRQPMQTLIISCEGKQVLKYQTDDSLVDLYLNYPHTDRVFARWEGGSHVRFTVFHVGGRGTDAKVVFDKQLEGAPDVVNTPDALLVHTGKRWLDGNATSLPTSTTVYLWNGDSYGNPEIWDWKESMRYEDRFCVLDPKKLSCPVGQATSNSVR